MLGLVKCGDLGIHREESHAYQSYDFAKAPKGEEHSEKHCEELSILFRFCAGSEKSMLLLLRRRRANLCDYFYFYDCDYDCGCDIVMVKYNLELKSAYLMRQRR